MKQVNLREAKTHLSTLVDVADLSAEILPVELKHIDRLSRLPLFHRDPFDRLIIAQSLEDNLTVMTRDRAFSAYPGLQLVTV